MKELDGFKSGELVVQFLWRVTNIKRKYNLTNCVLACFTNQSWLCGVSMEKFRSILFSNFEYRSGIMFNAGEFANVSAQWGITFNIWKTGETVNKNNFQHVLVESFDSKSQIRDIGQKTLYNRDNTDYITICKFLNDYISDRARITNKILNIKNMSLSAVENELPIDYLDFYVSMHGDYVQNNNTTYLSSGSDKYSPISGGAVVTRQNFDKACLINSIRDLISTNWTIDKDSYLIKKNQAIPVEFKNDCLIYSMFSNYVLSLKKNNLNCKNGFFWMSKQEILDLAEEYNNDYTYEDALNSEERFVHTKLQEIKDNLSPEAKAVLDKATDLVKNSFKYREMFNESHPEYQINNWDCGWYQIKALLKEFMPDDLNEFKTLYKQLADKMRPMVYELGFLKR